MYCKIYLENVLKTYLLELKDMSKKILVIFIVFVLVAVFLLNMYFGGKSLDEVSLTLKDLKDEGYKEFDKEYITEPYIAPNGTLFAGWNILEKYHVRFSKNDSCVIVIDIGKLESKDKCKEFLSTIKNTTFYGYDFIEIDSETIGDESYIGEDIVTISGLSVTLYFIVFRMDNVVVAFLSSDHTKEVSISYAKIMEKNLK
jgi:hypothetical protein